MKAEISTATAFRRLARHWLEHVAAQRLKAGQGNPTALHRMRVGIVHLRTACSFFSPMVADTEWTRLRQEFKWLNRYLGAARDLDVVMMRLRAAEDRSADCEASDREWNKRCADSHRRLARVFQSRRYLRLILDTSRWIDKGAWTRGGAKRSTDPAKPHFAKKLERWHKKLRRKVATLGAIGAHERHQFRFRIKKLRYAIEFFGNLFPRTHPSRQRAMLQCLTKAQECLGELNDGVKANSLADASKGTDVWIGRNARARICLSSKREKRLKKESKAAFGRWLS